MISSSRIQVLSYQETTQLSSIFASLGSEIQRSLNKRAIVGRIIVLQLSGSQNPATSITVS